MEQSRIDRINELARIAKERPLTEEELAERDALRKEYIAACCCTTTVSISSAVWASPTGLGTSISSAWP